MHVDAYDAARLLGRTLAVAGASRWMSGRPGGTARLTRDLRAVVRGRVLDRLGKRLAVSPVAEHREIAAMLAAAIEAEDDGAALALVSTAGRRPDLRAEKIVSRRYRFLWICTPKVASRSMIAALRAADPDADVIRGRTLGEVLMARPEARDYFRFAFLRHPRHRAYSFHADKHVLALRSRDAQRWFIRPYYGLRLGGLRLGGLRLGGLRLGGLRLGGLRLGGLRLGMSFRELCDWLSTPAGSDAFADRHWLSQSRQLRSADGRLPDFLGSWERLAADWRTIAEQVGMPFHELPRLNVRTAGNMPEEALDDEIVALLRLRYARDFELGGYAANGSPCGADAARARVGSPPR